MYILGDIPNDDYYQVTVKGWGYDGSYGPRLIRVAPGQENLLKVLVEVLKELVKTGSRCDKVSIYNWLGGYDREPTVEEEALYKVIDRDFLIYGGNVEKIEKIERVVITRSIIDPNNL